MNMPEEINRVITDRISTLLFCPTQNAMKNLSKEGFDFLKMKYFLSGDVMLDATLYYKQKALLSTPEFSKELPAEFALCTFHRSENIDNDERLTELVETLNLVSKNIAVVCPMHPHTEQRIRQLKLKTDFTILAPQSYFNMIHLLDRCLLVLTDSGGLQKEAYFHKKRCICLRNETEWTELSKDNYVIVTGIDGEKVISAVAECITHPLNFESSYYGDGTAGEFIVKQIAKM